MTVDEWRYLKDLRECVNYFKQSGNKAALEKDIKLYKEAMSKACVSA